MFTPYMKDSKTITITRTEALIVQALLAGKTKNEITMERGIADSTWFNHIGAIREKLAGGWKDDAPSIPKVPSMIQQIQAEILALIEERVCSLIQLDVISSRSLMREIRKRGNCYPCDVQISQALKAHGMVTVGRMLLAGERHYLWSLPNINRNEAAARVHERLLGHRI
jgi:hypothetical protein